MKSLSIIVAVSRNGVIGANGMIPWLIPEDFKFFKRTTLGHAVIMGRKTFDSIGRPLPNRRNIIVSRSWLNRTDSPEMAVRSSLDTAIALARETDEAPFIIGGAALYAEAMPLADTMYLTEVHRDVEGDTFFQYETAEWDEVSRDDTAECSWVTLKRRI